MDSNQIRGLALEIANRAKSDEAFMQELRDNPKSALTSAGLPEGAVNDFIREADEAGLTGLDDEVSGYASPMCDVTCLFTCLITY